MEVPKVSIESCQDSLSSKFGAYSFGLRVVHVNSQVGSKRVGPLQ